MHLVLVDQGFHYGEGVRLRLIKRQVQEPRDEIHPLAVVQVFINYSVRLEYVIKVVLCDRLKIVE